MKIGDIIKQVRWSVDEETGYGDFEDLYFNNIVKAKIGASLTWCALYADAALLASGKGTASSDVSFATDYLVSIGDTTSSPAGITYERTTGKMTLPAEALRVSRVRAESWKKGVSKFIEEDSDEYLMQSDETSKASNDRPVVAVIRTNPLKVQLFPTPTSGRIEVSLVNNPASTDYTASTATDTTEVQVPVKLQGSFIYYLAYLVMCAHGDFTKANAMLTIAKQQIAATTNG